MKEVKVEEIMNIIEEVLVEIYNSEYDEIRARVELLLKSKRQMAEQCIKGKWKLRAPQKLPRTSTPMVGMIYEGQDKLFSRTVVGLLVQMHRENNEAVLRTKSNKLISVDKRSLKIIIT